ncbi:beta-propeller fold lactonase family protein [bacterium]|nr:beta-propeller fold lactonase family protein [bacterium]
MILKKINRISRKSIWLFFIVFVLFNLFFCTPDKQATEPDKNEETIPVPEEKEFQVYIEWARERVTMVTFNAGSANHFWETISAGEDSFECDAGETAHPVKIQLFNENEVIVYWGSHELKCTVDGKTTSRTWYSQNCIMEGFICYYDIGTIKETLSVSVNANYSLQNLLSGNADLLSLDISSDLGTSSLTISSDTLYSDSVEYHIENITLTPVTVTEGSSVEINGVSCVSGSPSRQIHLNTGDNVIHIQVTSEDGTNIKNYTLIMKRKEAGHLTYVDHLTYGSYLKSISISPDGQYAYIISYSEISRFTREESTGVLTFDRKYKFSAFTSEYIDAVSSAISPDGNYLYIADQGEESVVWFKRDLSDGTFQYTNRFYVDDVNMNNTDNVYIVDTITASPDGKHVYVTTRQTPSVLIFRTTESEDQHLVYARRNSIGCTGPIAVSPDGNYVYLDDYENNGLSWFTRNPTWGFLDYVGTYIPEQDVLSNPSSIALSPDGNFVYLTPQAYLPNAVAWFSRDLSTGSLSYIGMFSDDILGRVSSITVSPDGNYVYVLSLCSGPDWDYSNCMGGVTIFKVNH